MYLLVTLSIAALLGLIPANIAKEKGYSFGLWWFYGWMLFIVAIIHVQFIPNKNEEHSGQRASSIPYCPPSQISAADEIKKYKDLLDQGVISQEEFDTKKKQILGL